MSSSTSNSDLRGASRRIYAKILLSIVLGMLVVLLLFRVIAQLNNASSASFLGRVLESQAALPQITQEPTDLALFFGSSMVQAGFSPREFDNALQQRGIELTTFNFGFGGLNPLFQDYLSRRIRDHFKAENRRLKLVLIEFNPFQTTQTRRDRARAAEDSFISLLASPKELWQVFLHDPERGIRLFLIRYLRDGVSAEMVTSHFGRGFRPPRQRSNLPEDQTLDDLRRELGQQINAQFDKDYPDYESANWYYPWQGGGTIPAERSAETVDLIKRYYTTLQTDYLMDNDRLFRIDTADILELNFDPELVEAFIRIVQNFQTIADHVEIVMLPKNSGWIQNPPEALQRQRQVVRQIEAATGAKVRDMQHLPSITPDMFNDTTHLARYTGAVAYTQHLVEQYAPLLH